MQGGTLVEKFNMKSRIVDIYDVDFKGRKIHTIRVYELDYEKFVYGFYLDANGEPLMLYFTESNESVAAMVDMHLTEGHYMRLINAIN